MGEVSRISPIHQTAKFQYLQWQSLYDEEKPFQIFVALEGNDEKIRETNLVFGEGQTVQVEDIRGREHEFQLDSSGFMIRKLKVLAVDWNSVENIERIYLSEVERVLKQEIPNVERVFFFDWRVRVL